MGMLAMKKASHCIWALTNNTVDTKIDAVRTSHRTRHDVAVDDVDNVACTLFTYFTANPSVDVVSSEKVT
jgi:hypothetical protein